MTETERYIREVRCFETYLRWCWPVHRIAVKSRLTPRCSRCVISAKCVPLENGVCESCRRTSSAAAPSAERVDELTRYIEETAGTGRKAYDALVLFSGGKDSTYMVSRLQREFPALRLLAFTVDNSFMSPVALANIREVIEKLRIAHHFVRPEPKLMERMFREAFLRCGNKGCSAGVDQFDGDFFCDLARNFAADNGIPAIFCGLSVYQVEHCIGLRNFMTAAAKERVNRTHVADTALDEIFSAEEIAQYWWQGASRPESEIPRMVFPFYAWRLPEPEIKEAVVQSGLLPADRRSPLLTNSSLVPLMTFLDFARLGYSSFEPEFAEMVRRGFSEPSGWREIFEFSEYACSTGRFVSKSVNTALARLSLERHQLEGL